ncbi:protein PIP82-like isoform X2 [Melanerpes formicivorus]|uniref:protein PIP82-like isoform X2 n=1 Tax=Melanerpes formicivorus TaxID=211600 RepID=UPI00358E62C4
MDLSGSQPSVKNEEPFHQEEREYAAGWQGSVWSAAAGTDLKVDKEQEEEEEEEAEPENPPPRCSPPPSEVEEMATAKEDETIPDPFPELSEMPASPPRAVRPRTPSREERPRVAIVSPAHQPKRRRAGAAHRTRLHPDLVVVGRRRLTVLVYSLLGVSICAVLLVLVTALLCHLKNCCQ